jgi:hypothetical protein
LNPVQAVGKEAHLSDLSFQRLFVGLIGAWDYPGAARTLRRTAAKHNILASQAASDSAWPSPGLLPITRGVENTYNFQIFGIRELTRDRHIPSKPRPQEGAVLTFDHAGARFARKERPKDD